VNNLQRSFDLLNLFQANQGASDATMETNDPILNDRTERKPVEEFINLIIDRVVVGGIFAQSIATFVSEAEGVVDPFVFVVSSEQMYLVWESDFQCH